MKKSLFFALATALLAQVQLWAADIDGIHPKLVPQGHVYGMDLTSESLAGRVVLLWNVDNYVAANMGSTEKKSDDSSNDNNNNRNKDESITKEIRETIKALKAAAKGSMKPDGKFLVVCSMSDPSKERVKSLRGLKLPFAVYELGVSGIKLYDATGKELVSTGNIKDISEGQRLPDALKETPDYVPGRIVLFATPLHESQCAKLVSGKNIDPICAQLMNEAKGSNPKGAEAKQILEAVDAYLSARCNDIEATLQATPSLAEEKIARLRRTSPMRARRYAGAANFIRKNPDVKTLAGAQLLLEQIRTGQVGKNDVGRKVDSALRIVTPLTKSKNSAIAAEASALVARMTPLTSTALEAQDETERAQRKESAAAERDNERRAKEEEKKAAKTNKATGANKRVSVADVFASSTAVATFKDELEKIDIRTANLDNLAVTYAKYEGQKGEKSTAAKTLIADIKGAKNQAYDAIKSIADEKSPKPLALFDSDDTRLLNNPEQCLTVNFPSLQNTPEGKLAMKLLRDSEVKRIAQTVEDLRGKPEQETEESGEDYAARCLRTHQKQLQSLQKYSNTNTAFGKLCLAQLATMGYSKDGLTAAIQADKTAIKEAATAAREAAKKKKANEREANK